MHEWTELAQSTASPAEGGKWTESAEQQSFNDTITWVFDTDGFTPIARLVGDESYSIITDHLGTPNLMFNSEGKKVWQAELDIYGKVRYSYGGRSFCPFRYPGQYEDGETGLYYNRFRYYDPEDGVYVSQDPIRLAGGMNLHAYVPDTNCLVDVFGLSSFDPFSVGEITEFPKEILFGQKRIAPNFSSIGSQASNKIAGNSLESVVEGLRKGTIDPNDFVISYTKDPISGKNVTINNRGLAALTMSGKTPTHAIFVPYDKVPKHLSSDWHNPSIGKMVPSNSIDITSDKAGKNVQKTVCRG